MDSLTSRVTCRIFLQSLQSRERERERETGESVYMPVEEDLLNIKTHQSRFRSQACAGYFKYTEVHPNHAESSSAFWDNVGILQPVVND